MQEGEESEWLDEPAQVVDLGAGREAAKAGGGAAAAQRLDRRAPDARQRPAPRVVVAHDPAGAAAEALRGLYYSLRRAQGGAPLGVLAVISSERGEGRSTIAANLAYCAARETGAPTALVDADLRAPKLHRLVGVEGEVGLSDVLANRADFEAVLIELAEGPAFLPGGRPEPEPARRFTSPRFARVLATLRHRFDEVIIDLPPMTFADARLIAPQCNGAVFVVRSGRTEGALARDVLASLDGVRVLGAVLNDVAEAEAPSLRAARKALPGR